MDKRTVAIIAGIWVAFEGGRRRALARLKQRLLPRELLIHRHLHPLGLLLYAKRWRHARHFIQFAVGLYMLVYLGFICGENMQMEGFWFYLFNGVFAGATIHYLVAKIAGPALFGRGWCGYACWTTMVLDLLPFKTNEGDRKTWGWVRFVMLAVSLAFACWLVFARPAQISYCRVHPIYPERTNEDSALAAAVIEYGGIFIALIIQEHVPYESPRNRTPHAESFALVRELE